MTDLNLTHFANDLVGLRLLEHTPGPQPKTVTLTYMRALNVVISPGDCRLIRLPVKDVVKSRPIPEDTSSSVIRWSGLGKIPRNGSILSMTRRDVWVPTAGHLFTFRIDSSKD